MKLFRHSRRAVESLMACRCITTTLQVHHRRSEHVRRDGTAKKKTRPSGSQDASTVAATLDTCTQHDCEHAPFAPNWWSVSDARR